MYSPMQLPFPFSHRTSLSYSASLKLWGLVDRCGRTRGAPRKRIAHQNLSCRVAQVVGVDWQEVPQGPPAHPNQKHSTKEQGWALCYGLNRPRGGGKNSVNTTYRDYWMGPHAKSTVKFSTAPQPSGRQASNSKLGWVCITNNFQQPSNL